MEHEKEVTYLFPSMRDSFYYTVFQFNPEDIEEIRKWEKETGRNKAHEWFDSLQEHLAKNKPDTV